MTQLFSPEYAHLQNNFHRERPDYGTSGSNYADQILQMANSLQTRSVLDYGCGKCTLAKALPFPIQNYDPFIKEYSQRPQPADLVVCTDVMEHVEEGYVDNVFTDIWSLTKKALFFQIATCEAKKVLPDGRNAHITIRDINWWLTRMMQKFEVKSVMNTGGGFVAVMSPLPWDNLPKE